MKPVRPRALILDFGGVISQTLFETHAQTERNLGLPAGSLSWRGPFDPASDPLWQQLQAGRITERDYWRTRAREVGQLVGQQWAEASDLVQRARGSDPQAIVRPEAVAAIDAAKALGCVLAVLSNDLALFYGPQVVQRLALLQRVDLVQDASLGGPLKPDPAAYLDCASALGVEPQACVMVDDQPANVRGAEAAGLIAVHFDVAAPAASFARALKLFAVADDVAGAAP